MKKILLIEDHQVIRDNIAQILVFQNFEVLMAENGKVGIEKARTENPDLIICGIELPEIDGYEVLRILHKDPKTFAIPFIFFTSKNEKNNLRKGMNLGADDFIFKPLKESDLFEAVEIRLKRSSDLSKNFESQKLPKKNILNKSKGLQELIDLPKKRKIKKFIKRDEIYREGDYANYLYYVNEGKVKCEKSDTHGKQIIIQIYSKGDYFGYTSLLQGDNCKSSAIAMNDTSVSIIPKDIFLGLITRNLEVAGVFIKMLSKSLLEREETLLKLAYSSVSERVSSVLLSLIDSCEKPESKKHCIDLSRDDLASIIGTAKESFTRELSELKKNGIIEIKEHTIFILDLDRLKINANGF